MRRPARCVDADPRDAVIVVRYGTDVVRVDIGLSVLGDGIGVRFRDQRWVEAPVEGRVKSVSLEEVIAHRTNGAAPTLVRELTGAHRARWPEGFLFDHLDEAVETLADWSRRYATDIIGGDAAGFGAIAGGGRPSS